MITKETYLCELCLSEYSTPKDAQRCEAKGLPSPVPYLPWGKDIPAFGEDGILHGEIESVFLVNTFGLAHAPHEWWCELKRKGPHHCKGFYPSDVSHNLSGSDGDSIPVSVFDPRQGYDFARYERGQRLDWVLEWEATMQAYGFRVEEAADHMLGVIERLRTGTL